MTGEINKKRGIAIFYTVIVAGIVLVVSYSISQIAFREVTFASLGKRSQQAFYAASSGLECALYWDLKHDQFVSSVFGDVEAVEISCAGSVYAAGYLVPSQDGNIHTTTFQMEDLGVTGDSCAEIIIEKTWNDPILSTRIVSEGIDDCNTSARKVERAIEVTY